MTLSFSSREFIADGVKKEIIVRDWDSDSSQM